MSKEGHEQSYSIEDIAMKHWGRIRLLCRLNTRQEVGLLPEPQVSKLGERWRIGLIFVHKNLSRSPLRCCVAMYRRLNRLQSLLSALSFCFDLALALVFWRLNNGKEFFMIVSWIDTVLSSITFFTKCLYWLWPTFSTDSIALATSSEAQTPSSMLTNSAMPPWKGFPMLSSHLLVSVLAAGMTSVLRSSFPGASVACHHYSQSQGKQTPVQRPSIFEMPLDFRWVKPTAQSDRLMIVLFCSCAWSMVIHKNGFFVYSKVLVINNWPP